MILKTNCGDCNFEIKFQNKKETAEYARMIDDVTIGLFCPVCGNILVRLPGNLTREEKIETKENKKEKVPSKV